MCGKPAPAPQDYSDGYEHDAPTARKTDPDARGRLCDRDAVAGRRLDAAPARPGLLRLSAVRPAGPAGLRDLPRAERGHLLQLRPALLGHYAAERARSRSDRQGRLSHPEPADLAPVDRAAQQRVDPSLGHVWHEHHRRHLHLRCRSAAARSQHELDAYENGLGQSLRGWLDLRRQGGEHQLLHRRQPVAGVPDDQRIRGVVADADLHADDHGGLHGRDGRCDPVVSSDHHDDYVEQPPPGSHDCPEVHPAQLDGNRERWRRSDHPARAWRPGQPEHRPVLIRAAVHPVRRPLPARLREQSICLQSGADGRHTRIRSEHQHAGWHG